MAEDETDAGATAPDVPQRPARRVRFRGQVKFSPKDKPPVSSAPAPAPPPPKST